MYWNNFKYFDFSDLVGLTLVSITKTTNDDGNDDLIFKTECGRTFHMYHSQDCCESVYIDDISGDLDDLIGSPIVTAYEASNEVDKKDEDYSWDSLCVWTFYKIATVKGWVDIRWYGHSNGYYGVGVDFYEVT